MDEALAKINLINTISKNPKEYFTLHHYCNTLARELLRITAENPNIKKAAEKLIGKVIELKKITDPQNLTNYDTLRQKVMSLADEIKKDYDELLA